MANQDVAVISAAVEEAKILLNELSQDIWQNPELCYNEVNAHRVLTEALIKLGFSVEKHYLLPTAFRAEFSTSKDGPTIAVLCEYDALPNIGHACGHNLIAEVGVGAGLAIKAALEADHNIPGKVVILGTPAEEGGGGKIKMIEAGAFQDIECIMMAHPDIVTKTFPLILGISRVSVTYRGKEAHASGHPWEGLNALDAAVACYSSIAFLKQHLKPNCKIHGVIRNGGIVPSIIPAKSHLIFYIRAPSRAEMADLKKRAEACFQSAALATGCDVHYEFDADTVGYEAMVINEKLAGLYQKHAKSMGMVFHDSGPRSLPLAVSSDIGNVSHLVPTIHPSYSIGQGPVNHSPGFTLMAGAPEAQPPTLRAAKALALTAVEVMRNPEMQQLIKDEFLENLKAAENASAS